METTKLEAGRERRVEKKMRTKINIYKKWDVDSIERFVRVA